MLLHAEAFEADEPEGSAARGSQYMSRKDLQRIGIALVVFTVIAFPVYQHFKRQGEKAICSNNMRTMAQALLTYGVDNDGGLPLAYYSDNAGNPQLHQGLPITWATFAQSGMNKRASFKCPSARGDEAASVTPYSGRQAITLTYGMFAGAAGRAERQFDRPSETVLLAETSNGGANETFNPLPLGKNDGFLIGLDVSNAQGGELKTALDEIKLDRQRNEGDPLKQGLREPEFVTRLAFPGTRGHKFSGAGASRHDTGINVIYVDGSLGLLRPPSAAIGDRYRWAVP
ncbi:MAG: hypothetical protein JNK63_01605 [Chthonomonas sp.]|nr:hypothetical protein [Chthonomonas sp.]